MLFFFSRDDGDDVGTQENEDAGDGFVPSEDILTQHDGHERGDDGLEIGIDGDRRGLEILHRKGDKEVTEGRGADNYEEHLQHAVPSPGCGIEGIGRQFRDSDGHRDNS